MVVSGEPNINNIMGGIENTGTVRLHNHKKKLKQRFDIIKKLGQGTYGKVQLGINKETGEEVAIKTIKKSKIESEADLIRIRREIQIMSSVQHPNIIHIYEVFENREKMILVMEYAAGGELYDYLSERKVLKEDEARRIFRQISIACYYCHKHKICHRDLKLENILLDEKGNAKIADFGLSNIFDDHRLLSTYCGSPLYASPEIVKGTPYMGPEVDCWSLGVLLYTLVYGAMPFDGSNFKRLVKQISQGDYFEPKNPSRASPLIREMLTVDPKYRANVQQICSHWWVNEGYEDNCLEVSEELANQTPVRLDLLLSLAPPPPQLESEKLVVTGESEEGNMSSDNLRAPARSQSVGSLREFTHPDDLRITDDKDVKATAKRKLESTYSTEQANYSQEGAKRKENVNENGAQDVTNVEDVSTPLGKSATRTISKKMDMDVEQKVDLSTTGAACAEIIADAKDIEMKKVKSVDIKPEKETGDVPAKGKENESNKVEVKKEETSKIPAKKRVVKKRVLTDKNENVVSKDGVKPREKPEEDKKVVKPVERRNSKVFESAEKFQNAVSQSSKVSPENNKKIIIPGVSVEGFKKEFERKASLSSNNVPQLKKPTGTVQKSEDKDSSESASVKTETVSEDTKNLEDVRKKKAVSIISTVLDKEGTRKSKSRPCVAGKKPPIPFGTSGRSASENISALSDKLNILKEEQQPQAPCDAGMGDKISSAEIVLKSATLPKRKTAKAEINLKYPEPKEPVVEFKTEMAHRVEAPKTQRTEAVFPVSPGKNNRSSSVVASEQEVKHSKERIIPICYEKEEDSTEIPPIPVSSKPPARTYQTQRSTVSQKSDSLSRQSTLESDSDTTSLKGEPIRKSPREYIIPIAVEGGGYVTPRAGSLEPSEASITATSLSSKTKFGRARRMSSLLNDREGSEDDSPFTSLSRRNSFGRDSDNEDSKKDLFRMHSLRSSRPRKVLLERNDSFSSGEDDDDDGFEILTAENLFSTLLSRVRDLTSRLNVDDTHPGLSRNSMLSRNLLNFPNRLENLPRRSPISRAFGREKSTNSSDLSGSWRHGLRHSDLDKDFNNSESLTHTATLPRGDKKKNKEPLNLLNVDLKKLNLSKEDALAFSYLTPGLSRRIQKQLAANVAKLPPSELKKLTRSMSVNESPTDVAFYNNKPSELPVNRSSSSLPQKYSEFFTKDKTRSCLDAKYDLPTVVEPPERRYKSRIRDSVSPSLTTSEESNFDNKYSAGNNILTKDREMRGNSYMEPYSLSTYRFGRSSSMEPKKSRFLSPRNEVDTIQNPYLREKNKREMQVQKILKEIRDKRRNTLGNQGTVENEVLSPEKIDLENGNAGNREYVPKDKCFEGNSKTEDLNGNDVGEESEMTKKKLFSKLVRPKSYPAENKINNYTSKIARGNENETRTRISRLKKPDSLEKIKKDFFEKTTEPENSNEYQNNCKMTNENTKTDNNRKLSAKNKLLQSIEKRFDRLRALNNNNSSSNASEEVNKNNKSHVEAKIRSLREQSAPPDEAESFITESGLIKRAVSVEDCPSFGAKPHQLQTSKNSVTKILNLFKKYEEKEQNSDDKRKEKSQKKKSQRYKDKPEVGNEEEPEGVQNLELQSVTPKPYFQSESGLDNNTNDKPERPKSLFIEKMKCYQNSLADGKSISGLSEEKHEKRSSKLPVNSFRRSLHLEPSKNQKYDEPKELSPRNNENSLTHGFSRIPSLSEPVNDPLEDLKRPKVAVEGLKSPLIVEDSSIDLNRSTTNNSLLPSPNEDNYSISSDYQSLDLPHSPTGQFHSSDECESVIDRIRRKSFYSRFNEKRKTRKVTLPSYRDQGFYDNLSCYGPGYRSVTSSHLDKSNKSKSNSNNLYRYDDVTIPGKSNGNDNINGYVNVPRYLPSNNSRIGKKYFYSMDKDNNLNYTAKKI